MAALRESGHYAIAGFLYQLIGSGVEALEVFDVSDVGDDPAECLVLERFGQDATVFPLSGALQQLRLVQFKFSGSAESIKPSELREVLVGFLRGVREIGSNIDSIEFKLVTNRSYSPGSCRWVEAKGAGSAVLEALIRDSCKSSLKDLPELAAIFQKMEKVERTVAEFRDAVDAAARAFGMLESEVEDRIQQLVGLLTQKAGSPNDRVVRRSEINNALAGFPNPYRLRGSDSVNIRLADIQRFQDIETAGLTTIPRDISNEIGRAILERPVIVVVGDGGSGKSIAASSAVLDALRDDQSPPGFGLVVSASRALPEFVVGSIARWRNRPYHADVPDFAKAMARLERAYTGRPLLVVCIDAIDERDGRARLPEPVQAFIRELMSDATKTHKEGAVPRISVVLTCRDTEEFRNLWRGFDPLDRPHEILVTDFDDPELERLSAGLNEEVRNRLLAHIDSRAAPNRTANSRSTRGIAPESILAIRHPIFWRKFCEMDIQSQHQCLDGVAGLERLAASYLGWFWSKTEIRMPVLGQHQCKASLCAVAEHFQDNPSRPADIVKDWVDPCIAATHCSRLVAQQIMHEALSAGIVIAEEKGARRWRWKHPWLCDFLARAGAGA